MAKRKPSGQDASAATESPKRAIDRKFARLVERLAIVSYKLNLVADHWGTRELFHIHTEDLGVVQITREVSEQIDEIYCDLHHWGTHKARVLPETGNVFETLGEIASDEATGAEKPRQS